MFVFYLVTVEITVKRTHRVVKTVAVRAAIPVSKREYLRHVANCFIKSLFFFSNQKLFFLQIRESDYIFSNVRNYFIQPYIYVRKNLSTPKKKKVKLFIFINKFSLNES